ncbi:Berberine bridge enzyme-like 18 [Citrus sinensis]|nr:Berberine bridge enzyme-like 18 [Citrus sinensis]
MKSPCSSIIQFVFVLLLSYHCWVTFGNIHATSSVPDENLFLHCLSMHSDNFSSISKVIYTRNNSSFSSILDFSTPTTPKPQVTVTPLKESHVQAAVKCSQKYGMQVRVRSGEAKTAWVQAGATIGKLYHAIAEKSKTLAFPAGVCPTVGVGGHFSGGGYGFLMRKYGLAADNVVDAHLIVVNGRLLDRKSMGEDLFWAIRGGGGASFGVIVAWKIKLVSVSETVTAFIVNRTLEQNATKIVDRWQYVADKLHEDLYIRVFLSSATSSRRGKKTIRASFESLFLGGADTLLPLMQQSFPELGLVKQDCIEMSWIESVMHFAGFRGRSLDVLLNRTQPNVRFFKAKSDIVKEPIPEIAFLGIYEKFYEKEAEDAEISFTPYGGIMNEISDFETPFPYRAGTIYKIQHMVRWEEEGSEASQRHINWIRRLYSYMAPYVSKNPRAAYVNCRDLDIGTNNKGYTSYKQASIWGLKYFNKNFNRLVHVKTMVDAGNFFRNEQSFPPLSSRKKNRD